MFDKSQLYNHLMHIGAAGVSFAVGHNLAQFRDTSIDPAALLVGMVFYGVGIMGIRHLENMPMAPVVREPAIKLEPGFEPMYPSELKPFVRVNNMPKLAYNTVALKINIERHIAATNLHKVDNGFPFDLTENTWARHRRDERGRIVKRKCCTRRELNEIKAKWEAAGMIYRLGFAKNAPLALFGSQGHELLEKVARGYLLPAK